ncbi:DUF2062 domain-containing protein [Candidatus Woesearchaeota archaeon]|nr:DUF2062 domain-containing protein [Candidatus Woesearchaeota archaeon]
MNKTMKGFKKAKEYFENLATIKTNPNSIALGFSIGTFVSILPTPGLSVLISLLIIFIYPKISKLAILAALVIWNPIILMPISAINYKIGDYILSNNPLNTITLFEKLFEVSKRILVGSLVTGTTIATISFFIVKAIAKEYQKKHEEKEKNILIKENQQ